MVSDEHGGNTELFAANFQLHTGMPFLWSYQGSVEIGTTLIMSYPLGA
jgi:hypothetical protein